MTLLEILKQLKNEVSSGVYPATGICSYVKSHNQDESPEVRITMYGSLDRLMREWPKSTGYANFPVPMSDDDRSYERASYAYLQGTVYHTLWQHSVHATLRHELLDWMIEQLEKQNEN